MKNYTRAATALLLGAATALVLVACGGSSSSSSSGNTSSTAASSGGKQGGTITIVSGTPPLSADQGLDFTTQGNELESVVNTPLLTFVRGVQGTAGSKIIPGAGQGAADRLRRREDLHVRPALGPELLQRDADQGLGRHVRAGARHQDPVAGGVVHQRLRQGRRRVRQGQGEDDLRDHDRRRDRHDHGQPGRAVLADRRHLRARGHGSGAAEHADEEPGRHRHDRRRAVQVGRDQPRDTRTP